jgi:hypothetical protein
MERRGRILKYVEMWREEGLSLQKGMNYCPRSDHSILLMSLRKDAPYRDRVEDSGLTLIYEGHDAPKNASTPYPKILDQPYNLPSGRLTENGKFLEAAQKGKKKESAPRRVRVYEKLRDGIWADNGEFALVDAWQESDGKRQVFKFKLVVGEQEMSDTRAQPPEIDRSRVIPSAVKQEVWLRDGGKCTLCDATDELHFDHVIPFSRGGSSLLAGNIQLLCARHNLRKRDKIE